MISRTKSVSAGRPLGGPGPARGLGRRLIEAGKRTPRPVLYGGGAALALGMAWATASQLQAGEVLSARAQARAALAAATAARQAEHEAFTAALAAREDRTVEVSRGETLALVLSRSGVPWDEINPAMAAIADIYNPRRMRPGQSIQIFYEPRGDKAHLTGLAFRTTPGEAVTVGKTRDGGFRARQVVMPLSFSVAHVSTRVTGSLFQSALNSGATEKEVGELTKVFAYDIDFQRDIFPGDSFEMVFERFADDEGRTVKTGDLMFAALKTRRGLKAYYRFQAPGDGEGAWYDENGRSARKFLMKTPIDGARLSSGFGMRRHPILGYSKMHQGTDFAARTGTPIRAAGDGVVQRASYYGGYGNYVRLRHGDNYDTAYAHLSRFAPGMRPGARVRQGQVIGYVGTTGRSTGPHLHYEVLHKGRHVNPIKLKLATGRNLDRKELELFRVERARIDALRTGGAPAPLVASAGFGPDLRGGLE